MPISLANSNIDTWGFSNTLAVSGLYSSSWNNSFSNTTAPSVVYKIGGKKYAMRVGRAYDFNNRLRHSVRNTGRQPRVNIFIDYYADPGLFIRNPLDVSTPLHEKPTPLVN